MESTHPVCPYDGSWMTVTERTLPIPDAPSNDVRRVFIIAAECQLCDCKIRSDDIGPASPDAVRAETWVNLRATFAHCADPQRIKQLNDKRRSEA